jgi:serine/threonine-protein kinase
MGTVWLVEDTVLKRRVALKLLDVVGASDDLPARLLKEARALASLEHPGIVPVHDAGTLTDGRAFYCMKYVEGHTLSEHIVNLSLSNSLRLMERIAEPLDFAHARGFLHRDLKPENIMIGAFGEVLIMDWGLAKVGAGPGSRPTELASGPTNGVPRGTSQGGILGTPGFMSPEQARGEGVDRRTDIYSLGAILWFLVSGSSPGDPAASLRAASGALRAICEKAMAADPATRYQSAGELATDVNRYLNGAPVSAYPENLLERATRLLVRHQTAVILVGVYLLMRVLFILFARR